MNINPQLKLALIRAYSKENGFAVVFVITTGLIMLIIATSILLRAHGGTIHAVTKKQSAASLAIAETGITQTLHMLNKYSILAGKDSTDAVWANLSSASSGGGCLGGSVTASAADNDKSAKAYAQDWVNVEDGRYKVLSYTVSDTNIDGQVDTATLEVEGQHQNDAISVVRVTAPLEPPGVAVPGVWADNSASDPIDVSHGTKSIHGVVCVKGTSYDSGKVNMSDIDTTPLYNGVIPGIAAAPESLPTPPTAPPSALPLPHWKGLSNCFLMLPRISDSAREDQNLEVTDISGSNCNNFNNVTSDTPVDGVYRYVVANDGGDSIDVSNVQVFVNPGAGERVELYLTGRLKLQGSSNPTGQTPLICKDKDDNDYSVNVFINQGDPSKLAIYGGPGTDEAYIAQTIIKAFMYLPNGNVKTSEGQIQGAVWAKQFQISNSGSACNIAIDQQDVGAATSNISGEGADIGAPNSWKRKEVPTAS